MAVKTFILSVLTSFLFAGGASAVPMVTFISDNLLQNYFDYTSLIPKSVNYQMMPVDYLRIGEKPDLGHYNNDQKIATPTYVYSSKLYSEAGMFVSYNSTLAKDSASCLFVGDIIELSVMPAITSRSASTSEAVTIMFMGFGLFTLGGLARRLQKIRELH
nr:hypothetical protein [Deltaproteobacteria bacterium]